MNKTAYDLLEKDPKTQAVLARCIKNMKKVPGHMHASFIEYVTLMDAPGSSGSYLVQYLREKLKEVSDNIRHEKAMMETAKLAAEDAAKERDAITLDDVLEAESHAKVMRAAYEKMAAPKPDLRKALLNDARVARMIDTSALKIASKLNDGDTFVIHTKAANVESLGLPYTAEEVEAELNKLISERADMHRRMLDLN